MAYCHVTGSDHGRLASASRILGIPLIDSLVVTEDAHYSILEDG